MEDIRLIWENATEIWINNKKWKCRIKLLI